MTINTWQRSALNICKYCKHFLDNKKSRNRYFCLKHKAAIYKSYGCGKLTKVFEEAGEVSRQALDKAFAALTGEGWLP